MKLAIVEWQVNKINGPCSIAEIPQKVSGFQYGFARPHQSLSSLDEDKDDPAINETVPNLFDFRFVNAYIYIYIYYIDICWSQLFCLQ